MPMWLVNSRAAQTRLSVISGIVYSATAIYVPTIFSMNFMLVLSGSYRHLQDADTYDPAARAAEADELTRLIEKINTPALAARASHLRQGIRCSIPPLHYDRATRSSVMGDMNYHIGVCFDDGVQWIARVHRFNATSPLATLRDYIIQSEVATLKFLERTSIPAPRVFDFMLDHSDNPVGRRKVMEQLANVFIELGKYPFDLFGSLDHPGDSHVGAFARESLTDFIQSEMRPLGPFTSSEEYHKSSLQLILDLVLREEMYSQQAVDAYLIHRFLLDLVPLVLSSSVQGGHKYYLKHADDKGDHILVDKDFNVTGIIDWEWAYTAPPTLAFNSPISLLPVAQFYEGAKNLGDDEITFARILEEKGHQDLANFVWNGRLQHRFAFCCGYDLADWNGFLGLSQGLRDAVKVDDGLDWDDWKTAALHRYRVDAGLQVLLSRHGNMSRRSGSYIYR
ncbi:hypothetical protein GGR58DRAFT_504463 [Xylaria digitata]|nr:hypothetical protein GGR58DRAFT_504463 [Xylaria digitata]